MKPARRRLRSVVAEIARVSAPPAPNGHNGVKMLAPSGPAGQSDTDPENAGKGVDRRPPTETLPKPTQARSGESRRRTAGRDRHLFEVVRENTDGRVQLVDWDKGADHAAAIADTLNFARDPDGRTLVTSGKFELGWRYSIRSSTPQHGSDATVSGVGRKRPGIQPRALGEVRRVGPSPGGSRGGVPRR